MIVNIWLNNGNELCKEFGGSHEEQLVKAKEWIEKIKKKNSRLQWEITKLENGNCELIDSNY